MLVAYVSHPRGAKNGVVFSTHLGLSTATRGTSRNGLRTLPIVDFRAEKMSLFRVLVVSDTHVPTIAQKMPKKILEEARASDLVIHAGDIVSEKTLAQLSGVKRVEAVRGNMDF